MCCFLGCRDTDIQLYGLRPAPAMPGNKNFIQETLTKGRKRDRQPRAASRPIMRSILETLSPVASEVASLSLRSIFSPKICGCLGRALQKCALNLYVGPSWDYVGPSAVYVWGPCSPILRLCWGPILAPCWTMLRARLDRRVPAEVIWGYVVFMTSPSVPKFCLKTLSPVACEAPTPFLQRYFPEKAESCWGRAHP